MKLLAASFLTTALLASSSSWAKTFSIGHNAVNNYAWSSGSDPCPGVIISSYDSGSASALCGHTFTLGTSTFRLSKCGDSDFQLQERAGGDGWVFNSYCYPPPSGDLRVECGKSTEKEIFIEQFTCGENPRRSSKLARGWEA